MARIFAPIHPPNDPRKCEPWLNNELRRISQALRHSSLGLAAVARGESPDGSGAPLPGPNLTNFWFKPGVATFGVAYGGVAPGADVVISSTSHTTKGFIRLGSPNEVLLVDEEDGYVGINKVFPSVALDVTGTSNEGGDPLLPITDIDANWAPDDTHYYTGSGTPVSHSDPHAFALQSDDDATSYVAILIAGSSSSANGTNPDKLALNGVILPGSVHTVRVKVATLGANMSSGANPSGFFNVFLVDSNGDCWKNPPAQEADLSTLTTTFTEFTFTVTCSGSSFSTGEVPNAVWIEGGCLLDVNTQIYLRCSYVEVVGHVQDIQHWHAPNDDLLSGIDDEGAYFLFAGAGTGKVYTSDSFGVGSWATPVTRVQFDWRANGPFQVMTEMDGQLRIPTGFTITSVRLYRKTAGSSGSTIVDLNKNGTTMFTTQGNRPTVTAAGGNNQSSAGTLPDVTSVAAGDVLSIDIDQIEGGTPTDFVLMIEGA